MVQVVISIIMVFLAVQVLPVAIGISVRKNPAKALLLIVVLVAIQVITFWLGLKLGSSFMHLMNGFKGVIAFIGFLLIGIRMLMEVFNIRKGERTYTVDGTGHIALASVAQGINSFLTGLLFYFIPHSEQNLVYILLSATLVVSIVGLLMKPERLALAFASLLYTVGGLVMLFSAVYFSFFYF